MKARVYFKNEALWTITYTVVGSVDVLCSFIIKDISLVISLLAALLGLLSIFLAFRVTNIPGRLSVVFNLIAVIFVSAFVYLAKINSGWNGLEYTIWALVLGISLGFLSLGLYLISVFYKDK